MPSANRYLKAAVFMAPLVLSVAPSRADTISAFCESHGGKVVEEQNANGSTTRYCVLKDGTRINAVAYFRNQHRTR